MPTEYEARLHHAFHYLTVVAEADELCEAGGEALKRGIRLFETEKINILAGQSWAKANMGGDKGARLMCSNYVDYAPQLIQWRLHPRERLSWLEAAREASRRLKNVRAE